ncbi:MAG: hypothetical protein PVG78_11925 [Desulfobacterales bacterium]
MYEIRADTGKNRLYINVGESNGDGMSSFVGDVDRACRQLGAGFTCLIHFMPGILLHRREEDLIFRLQNILRSYGVQKTVYVRPEGSVLGRFQLEMLHIHSDCPGKNACSLEEGEAILNSG